ncbi:hypothetical protein L5G32_10960 [Gordonia sp. HY002]|uniref:LppM family (lipo)protein n=1 Tax=Gordonia zhenghanii TaxID=2911516 RepID=UPI001EF08C15|nr:hypothetical protein [Gordonia zhenghanii]MCF8570787.1 hypothetical protein [Gordonia zhenghanii]MCF8603778.1 hypothetical protein [Gordonia zhenghanii]
MKSLCRVPILAVVALLALVPLLSGCLTKSTTVGDQFSGRVIVATSPDSGPTTPAFDIPASLSGQVWASDFPTKDTAPAPTATTAPDTGDTPAPTAEGKTGAQLSFDHLSTGQFGQLGSIVAAALPDQTATVDMKVTRSGDFVRLRGSTALAELDQQTSYVSITVDFAGPVVATNGQQTGDSTVTWIPAPGQTTEFNADAEYADPATAAVPSWSWFMLLLCAAVMAFIAVAAYKNRDNSPRPGRVLKSKPLPKPLQKVADKVSKDDTDPEDP